MPKDIVVIEMKYDLMAPWRPLSGARRRLPT